MGPGKDVPHDYFFVNGMMTLVAHNRSTGIERGDLNTIQSGMQGILLLQTIHITFPQFMQP